MIAVTVLTLDADRISDISLSGIGLWIWIWIWICDRSTLEQLYHYCTINNAFMVIFFHVSCSTNQMYSCRLSINPVSSCLDCDPRLMHGRKAKPTSYKLYKYSMQYAYGTCTCSR